MNAPWIDVSVPLTDGLPTWPGTEHLRLEWRLRLDRGDQVNDSAIRMSSHTGTHLDAPAHFINGGGDIASLSLDALIGPARVVEFPGDGHIDAAALRRASIPSDTSRLLFRTRNSRHWATPAHEFDSDFLAVAADGASWLVDHGVRLVGVDYLSVEPFGGDGSTHRTLLGAGVVVVEGLDLSSAPPGPCDLVCLPLRLVGAEGAPCRVVIRHRTES